MGLLLVTGPAAPLLRMSPSVSRNSRNNEQSADATERPRASVTQGFSERSPWNSHAGGIRGGLVKTVDSGPRIRSQGRLFRL